MTIIRLIADDLTGALDSAVQFVARAAGFPALLAQDSGGSDLEPPASAAISTGSRDLDPRAAAERATKAAPFLSHADIAFMKVDSLLRGNWPMELARLLAAFRDHTCIFAPAFPAQQRITENGRQFAPGPDGRMAPIPRVPLDALAVAGLSARIVSAGAAPNPHPGGVLICDAQQDEDLNTVVAAAKAMGGSTLWCGSAGLARALSGHAPPRVTLETATPLVVIGSQHSVTRAQIAAVPPQAAVRFAIGANPAESGAWIEREIASTPSIVTIDLPPRTAASEAAVMIAQRLAAVLPRLRPPERLVVIGGETLSAVCRAIGAEVLRLEGEWRPGVPCSRVAGGIWHGAPLISRSGAFGGPDFLADLLSACAGPAGAGGVVPEAGVVRQPFSESITDCGRY